MHRSQFELERVLGRYGATDFAFVEADARAAIQFAIDGRYVELALPLPDARSARFTHTASGRPRAVAAQERAYEQALREHWRGLLLAVRGKLQSVESGLSTFEDEFRSFLVPHREEKTRRDRKKPRAVTWLLGGSHSVAIALVAAFLVPASAVGAFALPPTVVGQLAAAFGGVLPNELGVHSDDARAVALGQSIWARGESASTPRHLHARPSRNPHRVFAATVPQAGEPTLAAPSSEPATSELAGLRQSGDAPASPPPPPAPSAAPPSSPGADKPAAPPESAPTPPAAPDEPPTPSEPAAIGTPEPDDSGDDSAAPDTDPPPPPPAAPAEPGKDTGHDNGNHNGADNGNKNGADNGNGNGKAKGH